MTAQDVLDKARDSFRRQSWEQAFAYFHATDADRPLDAEDLELLGRAAYLTGRDTDCVRALERAYQQRAAEGQHEQAAEAAFWLAFNLMGRGEMAQAGGWLARAEHLVALADEDCAVRGLLLVPTALRHLMEGDATTSLDLFTRAHELGRRCGDAELEALGALGEGQSWIALGEPARGLARLDEVMVAVTAGEVSPVVSGLVYCAVIVACQETYEVQRAAEWTKALSSWCDARPDLVPFRGQCLVHRAQILQLKGAWQEALEQVRLACRRLSDPPGQPAVGMALYEEGELHRLRGQYPAAEEAYRAASRCGHETQPGLALLRLAQGNLDAAHAGILRALDECHGHMRPLLLAAAVEIELAAGRLPEARGVAAELADLGGDGAAEVLRAMSAQATGAVLLAEGDPGAALARLRRAGEPVEGSGRALPRRSGTTPASTGLPGAGRPRRRPDGARRGGRGVPAAGRRPRPRRPGEGRYADARGARPAHHAGGPGPPGGGVGEDEPGRGRGPLPEREDRRPASQQHLRQARRLLEVRGDRLRLRAPPGLTTYAP